MSEGSEKDKKTLGVSRPNKLSLTKTVDAGKVTQNFTHGRSKKVTVEVRKTRTFSRKPDGGGIDKADMDAKLEALKAGDEVSTVRDKNRLKNASSELKAPKKTEKGNVTVATAKEEAAAPAQAKKETKPSSESEYVADESNNNGGVRDRKKMRVIEGPAAKDTRKSGVITAPTKAKPEPVEAKAPSTPAAPTIDVNVAPVPNMNKRSFDDRGGADEKKAKKIRLKGGESDSRRNSNKLTISQALESQDERMRSLASLKRRREKMKRLEAGGEQEEREKIAREVTVPEMITVQDFANRMAERTTDVIKELMKLGTMATATQAIDADTAELIAAEFGHTIKRVTEADVENILIEEPDLEKDMRPRAPVVTIMGHVDHGKTSLLDALRKTDVVGGEAGGITQHIGAYQIGSKDAKVTFLDTPGHEAFSEMRSRGGQASDIVILVVAGDDGIKAQTEEAISHSKAAEVPIIVAINKMDKPEADAERVKNELMRAELVAEEFGGDIQVIEVSAHTGAGLDTLMDAVMLQSEVLELKANPNRKASGVVVEAEMDKNRGAMSTFLLQKGTLRVGDIVVAGQAWGKVRAMHDDKRRVIKKAIPSQPVEVLGLDVAPMAGEGFAVVEDEKTARDITEYRDRREKERRNMVAAKTLDQLFAEAKEGEHKILPLIIKGDVQGSIEAIIGSASKFNNEEVSIKVLHSGVGGVNESDVSLAIATGAIIVGFNVRASNNARTKAEEESIDIRYYSIIYDLVDDIKAALSGMLSPDLRENLLGYAKINEVFNITKVGKVAGCNVTEGMIKRGAKVRLLRDSVVIHEGTLKTLKRFKDEVKEVKSGYECGMAFENYDDIREGDQIEAFEVEEIARSVEQQA